MVCLSVFLNWVALLVLLGINVTSIFNEIVNQLGKIWKYYYTSALHIWTY